MNIISPSHPLRSEFRRKAPGSYDHSLGVAALSNAVALDLVESGFDVEIDPEIALGGGLIHDVGKMISPASYVENRGRLQECLGDEDVVSWDSLPVADRNQRAAEILAHPLDGFEIAEDYDLPDRVRECTRTHHGDGRAFESSDNGEEPRRYDGPKPGSLEEVIVMIADVVDAAVNRGRNGDAMKIDYVDLVDREVARKTDQFEHLNLPPELIEEMKKSFVKYAIFLYTDPDVLRIINL
ncbi:HD domain-containing protein [Candidatus Peregrinibacteria bacterium]|nr:HD domain-containing protein [Candidatus Peregrinibacteria bacterium]